MSRMRTISVSPGSGAAHRDRTGQDVNSGATIGLGDARPQRADAVVHQQVRRVAGMVRDRLDLDDVARVDLQHCWCVTVDVPPHAGVGRRVQAVLHRRRADPCR